MIMLRRISFPSLKLIEIPLAIVVEILGLPPATESVALLFGASV
jgi:hypothetical protein